MMIHVVSVSGGKDSLATLLLAIERFGRARIRAIFCDTGNEHAIVYEYLDYLEVTLGIKIHRLKANFDMEIARKRRFIAHDKRSRRHYDEVPLLDEAGAPVLRKNQDGTPQLRMVWSRGVMDLEGIPKMRKVDRGRVRWTNKAKRRALAVLHPSGNPFLDLCLWKGRFPSRKAQFCTEHLKRNMAVNFQLDLVDQGYMVISWQGIRRDESQNRANAKAFERVGGGIWIYRPIVEWSAAMVFELGARAGIKPNPLYLMDMSRVGCMPCINVSKDGLRAIAHRFPEALNEKAEWERLVSLASKRGGATFITTANTTRKEAGPVTQIKSDHQDKHGIWAVVQWARTTRGGQQLDLLDLPPSDACSSSYGLCG